MVRNMQEGLTDRSGCIILRRKLDDTGSLGATVGLVLNLSTLDFADGGKELDEVFITSGPGKLTRLVSSMACS